MPRTIEEGFRDFLTRLTPSEVESERAGSHREAVLKCLQSHYRVHRFFRTGSFGNGTSIYGYSDVDYFASIECEDLSADSTYALQKMRGHLDRRFPRTEVGVRCPAVRVPFGSTNAEAHEIVPACSIPRKGRGFEVFWIPDCAGGWMKASPEAHNAFVRDQDYRLGYKLKPLIRFMKAWKFYNSVPISSFYLEMRVASFAPNEQSILYAMDLRNVFAYLDNHDLPAVQDPAGVSGLIEPCATQAKFQEARSKITTARKRADKAREAEDAGDIKEAFECWDLLFGYRFPSYYY